MGYTEIPPTGWINNDELDRTEFSEKFWAGSGYQGNQKVIKILKKLKIPFTECCTFFDLPDTLAKRIIKQGDWTKIK